MTNQDQPLRQHVDERLKTPLSTLEGALTSVNASIAETCNKLDALYLELKSRQPA